MNWPNPNHAVLTLLLLGVLIRPATLRAEDSPSPLANATILIIRHAEKPASGKELNEAGQARAKAYPAYFQHLTLDGQPVKIDAVFATADSKGSCRPRRTVEPTARALGLPLDTRFSDKNADLLAKELETRPHGKTILICWHHGQIPELVHDLGAKPASVLPHGSWPAETFDWMLVLHYNAQGQMIAARRVPEHLMPGDSQ